MRDWELFMVNWGKGAQLFFACVLNFLAVCTTRAAPAFQNDFVSAVHSQRNSASIGDAFTMQNNSGADGVATSPPAAPGAVLSVSKTSSVSTFMIGDVTPVAFSISVTNSGNVASTGTQLGENPDPDLVLQSYSCSDGQSNSTGSFPLTISVPANGTFSCSVQGLVQGTTSNNVNNTATVTPVAPDQCAGAGSCSSTSTMFVTEPPIRANFFINKSASISSYSRGVLTSLTYTLKLGNTSSASGSTGVSDLAPPGVTFTSWTCPGGQPASGSGNLSSTMSIAANGDAGCMINATIASSATGTIVNTASVSPADKATCLGDCTSTAIVTADLTQNPSAVLLVSNSPSITFYQPGETGAINYSISIANSGNAASGTFQVSDLAPPGLTLNDWYAPGCSPVSGYGNISTACSLNIGAGVDIRAWATLETSATGNLASTVTVTPSGRDLCAATSGCSSTAYINSKMPSGGATPSSVTLSASSASVPFGTPVNLTARISGGMNPTGTVIFYADAYFSSPYISGQILCESNVIGSTATCSTSALGIGIHPLVASYGGDSTFGASLSASLDQSVTSLDGGARKLTLSTTPNPSSFAREVSFVAGLSPGLAGGVVNVTVDGNNYCTYSVPVRGVPDYAVACTNSTLSAGTHVIGATWVANSKSVPSVTAASVSQVVNSPAELYVALNPGRLLDTRIGTGYTTIDGTSQGTGPIARANTYRLPITGRAGIPSEVAAVALNVTPVNPPSPGYFTVWSGIDAAPNASNLNLNPGYTIPNLVISPVDSNGNVALFNGSSAAQNVVVDVQGYFPSGSAYVPMTPQRYLDTRAGYATVDGRDQALGALVRGRLLGLGIVGRSSIPSANVGAVVFNLTAVQPSGTGYITAWPSGATQPNASNLNLNTGLTIPNLVISGLGSGQVSLYNGSAKGAVDLIADVQGWFPANSGYAALTPVRLLDTRSGQSTIDGRYAGLGALAAAGSLDLQVAGRGGVPAIGTGTVVLNVTAVLPSQAGYVTIWPTGSVQPLASNLNLNPGATIPNLVLAKVGSNGKVSIFNGSKAPSDILVDVQGWLPAGQ